MWFEGKWMQSEDITLSEVNQAQKGKGRMFPLIRGRQIQKINKYTMREQWKGLRNQSKVYSQQGTPRNSFEQ
jgi:hypothetical protein